MKIEEIDKNLRVETALGRDDIVFSDVKNEPFRVYGLYNYKNEPRFIRMPAAVAEAVSPEVAGLAYNTAGGRVRFSTDSPFIAIRCKMKHVSYYPDMPLSGSSGFDLYLHTEDGRDTFYRMFMPPHGMKDGYEALQQISGDGKMHSYTIHFPLYNDVISLEIGLQRDAQVAPGADYRHVKPVVYYGSSITQGGNVCRPGNTYENIISSRNNVDHINLGFSGAAKAEDAMIEYLAGLDAGIFVLDYDHNAPTVEHLQATHEKLFKAFRAAHPDTPVVMVTRPNAHMNEDDILRRNVVYETFMHAYTAGDRNVSFIDGYTFFEPGYHDLMTEDGCHPSDSGHICMARVIGREIDRILRGMSW